MRRLRITTLSDGFQRLLTRRKDVRLLSVNMTIICTSLLSELRICPGQLRYNREYVARKSTCQAYGKISPIYDFD